MIAALRSGKLSVSCRDCQNAPSLKEEWGCEEPKQWAVWADGEYEFYSCPMLFVKLAHFDFVDRLNYQRRYRVAPIYENESLRFLEAEQALDGCEASLCNKTNLDGEIEAINTIRGLTSG